MQLTAIHLEQSDSINTVIGESQYMRIQTMFAMSGVSKHEGQLVNPKANSNPRHFHW